MQVTVSRVNNFLPTALTAFRRQLTSPEHRDRLEQVLGMLLFVLYLAWFYRVPPWLWFSHLPKYGDVVEALWQIEFWRNAVVRGELNPVSYAAMWPIGTHLFTIAHNGVALLLLPVALLFGSTFAVNFGFVASHVLSFAGSTLLLKQFTRSPLLASIGSIIATFALGRTVSTYWYLNVSLATALGPWLLWLAHRTANSTGVVSRSLAIFSGLIWGASIVAQPYYAFIFGIALLVVANKRLGYLIGSAIAAALVAAPYLIMMRSGQNFMVTLPPNLENITFALNGIPMQQASLYSVVGWSYSPWQESVRLTHELRRHAPGETHVQRWGILVWLFTLLGALVTIRRRMRPLLTITVLLLVALILSLGPFWINAPLPGGILTALNQPLWEIGSIFKPHLFDEHSAQLLVNTALPLPSSLLYAVVPYYEMARVPGRFLILVGYAAVILSIVFLSKLPPVPKTLLGVVWLVELLPLPTSVLPAPPTPHPAHRWVAQNYNDPAHGVLSPAGPLWVYSAHLAKIKGTGTLGSFMPAYALYTAPWIYFSHHPYIRDEQTLTNPDLVNILVRAQVKVVLLTPKESEAAQRNPYLRFIRCFSEEGGPFKYGTPLCAFEVTKSPAEVSINVQPTRGFSGFEIGLDKPDRLIWVDNHEAEAEAGWWLTDTSDHVLEMTFRAFCPRGQSQSAKVFVNEAPVAQLSWSGDCWEQRTAMAVLPRDLLKSGWNVIRIKAASAARPAEHLEGSTDRRWLSVAVERLHLRTSSPLPTAHAN